MNHTTYLIGNAHLDLAWLWSWQEGFSEIKATFRSALDRMNEFDDYVFTAAGAAYYQWVEENEPALFEEIRARVAQGRWVLAGGWWLQPDCNLPCGESFARQGLYGQRYFYKKFGKTATFGYNVDSFGHNAALPQLLHQCGLNNYVMMRPENHEKPLENNSFFWQGIDGTQVLTYRIPTGYGTSTDNHDLISKCERCMQLSAKDNQPKMFFYGVGNHGGGPTISCLQMLQQAIKNDSSLQFGNPEQFFSQLRLNHTVVSVVEGDLQHHAIGCYSANSEIKANNRRSENRLLACEKMMTIASYLVAFPYQQQELQQGWKDVLFNQFHDILGGCSIKAVYDSAREFHGEALKIGASLLNATLQRLSWNVNTAINQRMTIDRDFDFTAWENEVGGSPIVVFNLNAWETIAVIALSREVSGATDENGCPVPHQRVRGDKTCNNGKDDYSSILQLTLPPLGYRTLSLYNRKQVSNPVSERPLKYGSTFIENQWLRLELNPSTGSIRLLLDKNSNCAIFDGDAAVAEVIEDFQNDTWAHNAVYLNDVIATFGNAHLQLLERGPIRATIRATSTYGASRLTQDFTLYRDYSDLDVSVTLNWQEPFKILKFAFPVNVLQPAVTYEIPYGCITKITDGKEEPGQCWFDLSGKNPAQHDAGVSIVTSGQYSYSAAGHTARFVAVRSAGYADHYGIKDEFTEAMDLGIHTFRYSILPHSGSLQPAVPTKKAAMFNQPPVTVYETYHQGPLPLRDTFASTSADNIMLQVLKRQEDGDGVVLRAYETDGVAVDATVSLPFLHQTAACHFCAHEIKTIRFSANGTIDYPSILEI